MKNNELLNKMSDEQLLDELAALHSNDSGYEKYYTDDDLFNDSGIEYARALRHEIKLRMSKGDDTKEQFKLYGVLNLDTNKLVSNITNPRHKFWEKKGMAQKSMDNFLSRQRYCSTRATEINKRLEVVEILCTVKRGGTEN